MKILIVFCLCLSLTQISFSQSEEFYEKLLNNKASARNSYFIALDVKSSVYNGRVIVTNGNLYYFLSETKKFNEKQYDEFMTNLLSNKDKLPLKKVALVRRGDFLRVEGFNSVELMLVKSVESVEEIAIKGCEILIKYYFEDVSNNYRLKNNIGDEERNAIVNRLFEWQIPTFVSDYSGELVIKSSDFKCPPNKN